MSVQAPIPRQPVLALDAALTAGGRFVRGATTGELFDLVVFYRDLHCPICAKYLLELELERLAPQFAQRGVRILAVSGDDGERGRQMADKVTAAGVRFAYRLSLQSARQWEFHDLPGAVDLAIARDCPARGECTGEV